MATVIERSSCRCLADRDIAVRLGRRRSSIPLAPGDDSVLGGALPAPVPLPAPLILPTVGSLNGTRRSFIATAGVQCLYRAQIMSCAPSRRSTGGDVSVTFALAESGKRAIAFQRSTRGRRLRRAER